MMMIPMVMGRRLKKNSGKIILLFFCKRMPKLYFGARGGMYYRKGGRRVYVKGSSFGEKNPSKPGQVSKPKNNALLCEIIRYIKNEYFLEKLNPISEYNALIEKNTGKDIYSSMDTLSYSNKTDVNKQLNEFNDVFEYVLYKFERAAKKYEESLQYVSTICQTHSRFGMMEGTPPRAPSGPSRGPPPPPRKPKIVLKEEKKKKNMIDYIKCLLQCINQYLLYTENIIEQTRLPLLTTYLTEEQEYFNNAKTAEMDIQDLYPKIADLEAMCTALRTNCIKKCYDFKDNRNVSFINLNPSPEYQNIARQLFLDENQFGY